jgi:hypothetical protein|uniref:Uncharacterized protein n=1 Tax=Desulfobacca acetoxidans TaxID=60893 RepID=A0A7V6DR58_9BACT
MTNLKLFASLGFFEGMGRVMDLYGTMMVANESISPKEADTRAIMSDWQAVGEDIAAAINNYAEGQEKA